MVFVSPYLGVCPLSTNFPSKNRRAARFRSTPPERRPEIFGSGERDTEPEPGQELGGRSGKPACVDGALDLQLRLRLGWWKCLSCFYRRIEALLVLFGRDAASLLVVNCETEKDGTVETG